MAINNVDTSRAWFQRVGMRGQTVSQPYVVALMTELAAVGRGSRVLEVGTGSGYQAAALAELGADVYSIEVLAPLRERAGEILSRLGYGQVKTRVGDGYLRWPEAAPFDAKGPASLPVSVQPTELRAADVGVTIEVDLANGHRLRMQVKAHTGWGSGDGQWGDNACDGTRGITRPSIRRPATAVFRTVDLPPASPRILRGRKT